jgi:hypothetical protein
MDDTFLIRVYTDNENRMRELQSQINEIMSSNRIILDHIVRRNGSNVQSSTNLPNNFFNLHPERIDASGTMPTNYTNTTTTHRGNSSMNGRANRNRPQTTNRNIPYNSVRANPFVEIDYFNVPLGDLSSSNSPFINLLSTLLQGSITPPHNVNTLTLDEINGRTSLHIYGEIENPIDVSCPITQTQFDGEDEVMMINHCRHIFTPNELRNWFHTHTTCPVCRYDLKTDMTNINASASIVD